jgi:iron complex outermembrane recepter protein
MTRRLTPVALACISVLLQAEAAHGQQAVNASSDKPDSPKTEGPPATGSAASPDPSGTQIEVITITAQRRSEVLSKAPLAVTVTNQNLLDERGITAVGDIVTAVPNLQPANNGFSIRGIGNNNPFTGYATVAVQVDGIYEPSNSLLGLGLYDITRIETLRGPQGTAYGRNATAGVVNIHTARPVNKFLAFGDVAIGNYQDRTARAVVNVPVNDRLQLRGSVLRRTSDGYDEGGASPRNYGAIDVLSTRLAAAWKLTPDLLWNASLSQAENKSTLPYSHRLSYSYYPGANIAAGTRGPAVVVAPAGDILAARTEPDIAADIQQTALRSSLAWSLNNNWTLTYLAGRSRLTDDGVKAANGLFRFKSTDMVTRTQSHELDLNYESERLKAVAGLYRYRDRQAGLEHVGVGDALPYPFASVVPPPLIIAPGTGFEPTGFNLIDFIRRINGVTNTSKAAFAQATYSLSDALRLTGGLRYTRDKVSNEEDLQACAPGSVAAVTPALACGVPFGPPVHSVGASRWSKLSWKTTAEYDLTKNHLLYATVATGYRGGGATLNVAPQFQTFAPETLTNFELGWRGLLFNNRLGLNLTAFNMNYKNLQITAIGQDLLGNNTPVTTNAATAKIRGVEFEGDWKVTRSDRLQGFITYLNARFGTLADSIDTTNNLSVAYNQFAPTPIPPGIANYSGNRLVNAPRVSLRGRYSHVFNLGHGTLTPSVDVYWQAKSYTNLDNISDPARGGRRAYSKTDLNLLYQTADGHWSVNAFVHNVEDKKVYTSTAALSAFAGAAYMPPRTFGIRVGYNFK